MAHFGCPDSVRFHTSGTSIRYLRVFRANPERLNGGEWINPEGVLDVSFGVPSAIKEHVLRLVNEDLKVRASTNTTHLT